LFCKISPRLFSITYQLCYACGNRKLLIYHHIPALFFYGRIYRRIGIAGHFQCSSMSPACVRAASALIVCHSAPGVSMPSASFLRYSRLSHLSSKVKRKMRAGRSGSFGRRSGPQRRRSGNCRAGSSRRDPAAGTRVPAPASWAQGARGIQLPRSPCPLPG